MLLIYAICIVLAVLSLALSGRGQIIGLPGDRARRRRGAVPADAARRARRSTAASYRRDVTAPTTSREPGDRPTSEPASQGRADPLLYSRRVTGAQMNDLGRVGAYLALFSEIAIILLVTTLLGVLRGYWLDQRLGTLPILYVVGMLAGFGLGGVGVYRLIVRFLARFE